MCCSFPIAAYAFVCPDSLPHNDGRGTNMQVSIPLWSLVHLPAIITLTTALFTPRGWIHALLYVLFENAMGIVKVGAAVAGALQRFLLNIFCNRIARPATV
jgi:hypothetical protein